MPAQTCFNCAFKVLSIDKCPIIGISYNQKDIKVCPYWTSDLPKCDICGGIDLNYVLFAKEKEAGYRKVCSKCKELSGTCGGCLKSSTCDFETNPSPIPKAVQKTIQQGNFTRVETIKNPDRIRETCQKNCDCFLENFGCCRELNTCGNFEGAF